ncbi:copper homeostasis protein CutC [Luethyella okanaganae]|uniref:PF03932 family protein CutC n=1 Tax=Luethyella okanaganae TaxID=69372 RepID=A0ABW1VAN8_9MICO
MTARSAIEIAVQDADGVATALSVGADRVELCGALSAGGLTPSIGLIGGAVDAARAAGAPGFVHVLVRPRPGGFVYSPSELATTVRDIRAARDAGADGVVIGALTRDGEVDIEATRELVAAADGLNVTFHRAIDAGSYPLRAIDVLLELGLHRVLTSGGAVRSIDGVRTLATMVERSVGRLQIMAGGGVRVEDIPTLLASGVDAVHLSARRVVDDVAPSGPGGGEASFDRTDEAIAAAAVSAVHGIGPTASVKA